MVRNIAVAALALASSAAAAPALSAQQAAVVEAATQAWTVDQSMLAAFGCEGQSCVIADTAGSTGRNPIMKAEGADDSDIACIVKFNPPIGELLSKYKNQVPDVPKQNTSFVSTAMSGLNKGLKGFSNPRTTGKYTGKCANNILIFAKGTLEPGQYGITVGPQFTSGLGSNWTTGAVDYDPDVAGDYCLGLPGGMVAKDVIDGAHKQCPNANLFVSGYSQGAMVIRNGLARASDSAKAKVKGVITFGDPFNGAPIKGYKGPIEIYCNVGDGVCTGNFELAGAHLAYIGDGTVAKAKAKLQAMAKGQGDQSCCKPKPLPELPSPEVWAQSVAANGGKVPKAKAGTTVDQWAAALGESKGKVPKFSEGTK